MRSKWDLYGLTTARQQAEWSKDPGTKVGAVILRPSGTIAATGWNGFPRGIRDDDRLRDREVKLDLILHAEMNALLTAVEPLEGYTLYVWPFHPCVRCAAAIIQAGIKRVVVPAGTWPLRWRGSFQLAYDLFCEADVMLVFLDPKTGEPGSATFVDQPPEPSGISSNPSGNE